MGVGGRKNRQRERVEAKSGTPLGCGDPIHVFRWSFPPCPERPPATFWQPSGLASGAIVRMSMVFPQWPARSPARTARAGLPRTRLPGGRRAATQPQDMDCGGKRSATPLLVGGPRSANGVAAALCHRSPNLRRPAAELRVCSTASQGRTSVLLRIALGHWPLNEKGVDANFAQALAPADPA